MAVTGRRIRIRGRVHGVGFRPFVWRAAHRAGLSGHVSNDGAGVLIDAWGEHETIDAFLSSLEKAPPPLARIEAVEWTNLTGAPASDGFEIAPSEHGPVSTEIAPDAAVCSECLAEIFDPGNRRYRYPFTNCTHCGPRLSIVKGIPYDRAFTSMAEFAMCPDCLSEFEDPANRRFHAQPIACPECGPKAWLENGEGPVACDDPVIAAALSIKAGKLVAIKGIGAFHLACDATSPAAVAELRRRKHRVAKPFALMARDLGQIRRLCRVTAAEADALQCPAAPIVVLDALREIPDGVAPGLDRLGVMLPYTPLHHLLMAELDRPIVLTSGNLSSAPPVTCNATARRDLAECADLWLMHDRAIVTQLDDSVMALDRPGPSVLRRARGLAPAPIPLDEAFAKARPVLATGGDLKSTFCILNHGQATLSPHLGDLSEAAIYSDFRRMIDRFADLYRFTPELVAVDCHPDYASARWGRSLAAEIGAPVVEVQHHHAHLASCLAEHHIPADTATIGIVLDGTGYGLDGTIWGGEILLGGYYGFQRMAHLPVVCLPGGATAVQEPWRNTVAQLVAAFGPDWRRAVEGTDLAARLADKPAHMIEIMIEKGINAPLCSSAGRMFDAVAGALGICDHQHHEGQAAMALEAIATPHFADAEPYPLEFSKIGDIYVPACGDFWVALLDDLKTRRDPGVIAARFHQSLITVIVGMTARIAEKAGTSRIALSGGVLQNRLVRQALYSGLRECGFDVLTQMRVPSNDGGLSLGQAVIAAHQSP